MKSVAIRVAALALLNIAIGLTASYPAKALELKNRLWRCSNYPYATLCYSAFTITNTQPEVCQYFSLGTRGNAIYGSIASFFPVPNGWSYAQSPSPPACGDVPLFGSGYTGFIEPCAPGTMNGYTHDVTHELALRPPYTPAFQNIPSQKWLDFVQSGCGDGGGPFD